jgi:sulfonate transport system ATP-binding protein
VSGDLAVRIDGARKAFGDRHVLDGFSLDVHGGEFVALLGRSGTGKTTLLRVLLGLEQLDDGQVLVPRRRTVVFQEPRLLESTRVLGNVLLGQRATTARREAAQRALAEVGLERHANAWPATLSGGEAQRVALARALVRDPQLLLLDEPFAALDALTRLTMQRLVAELCRRHRPAVLLVTHDVEEAILLADRIVVLGDGRAELDVRVSGEEVRHRGDPQFLALRSRLLDVLGVPAAA